jgi:hypothetical protein
LRCRIAGEKQYEYYYGPLTLAWFAIPKDSAGKPVPSKELERYSEMAKYQNELWNKYEELRISLGIPVTDPTY